MDSLTGSLDSGPSELTRPGDDPGHPALHGARAGPGRGGGRAAPTSSRWARSCSRCWPAVRPSRARPAVEVFYATLHEQPPALTGSPAVVATDRVIRRALQKRADDRPASAEALLAELQAPSPSTPEEAQGRDPGAHPHAPRGPPLPHAAARPRHRLPVPGPRGRGQHFALRPPLGPRALERVRGALRHRAARPAKDRGRGRRGPRAARDPLARGRPAPGHRPARGGPRGNPPRLPHRGGVGRRHLPAPGRSLGPHRGVALPVPRRPGRGQDRGLAPARAREPTRVRALPARQPCRS